MSAEDNKNLIRRYREIHNKGNLAELDKIVAKDIVSHNVLPGLPPGPEGAKAAHQVFLASFPDLQGTTEDLIAEGDKVMERYTVRGTHKGPFMGAPATGKKFAVETIAIFRIANGKIVEQWGMNDAAGLMAQLGLAPAPGPAK